MVSMMPLRVCYRKVGDFTEAQSSHSNKCLFRTFDVRTKVMAAYFRCIRLKERKRRNLTLIIHNRCFHDDADDGQLACCVAHRAQMGFSSGL